MSADQAFYESCQAVSADAPKPIRYECDPSTFHPGKIIRVDKDRACMKCGKVVVQSAQKPMRSREEGI